MAFRPLLEPDEGRYAEIPREMVVNHDWITPHLNGVRYLEKPPLQYWATAAGYAVLGVSEWTARWFAVTMSFLCLPLVYVFASRLHRSAAIGAAATLALAVNPVFAVIGQLNLLDGIFAFFLSGALFAVISVPLQERGSAGEYRCAMAMWAAMALAVLTKGIATLVLAGATLTLYSLLYRDVSIWRRLHWLSGLALFLVLVVPWFALVSIRNDDFLQFFFVHEHMQRFLTTIHSRTEPWWFFVPLLALSVAPWFRAMISTGRDALAKPEPTGQQGSIALRMLSIWCVVVVVFFSVSQSKLATYIVPVLPALAVVLAPRTHGGDRMLRTASWWVFGCLLLFGGGCVVYQLREIGVSTPAVVLPAIVAVIAGVAGVVVARGLPRAPVRAALLLAAVSVLGWSTVVLAFSHARPGRTARDLVAQVAHQIGAGTKLYSVLQYRQSIPPYLGRTLQMVGYRGELDFGLASAPPGTYLDIEEFVRSWHEPADAVAFIEPTWYASVGAQQLPGTVIARDRNTVVVRR